MHKVKFYQHHDVVYEFLFRTKYCDFFLAYMENKVLD